MAQCLASYSFSGNDWHARAASGKQSGTEQMSERHASLPIAGLAMLPREYKRVYRQASYTSPVLSDKMASILSLASVISAELEEQIAWVQARALLLHVTSR